MRALVMLVMPWCLVGCFEPPCETPFEPGGVPVPCFAPSTDAAVPRPDSGVDAGAFDAGRVDAGTRDAGGFDAGRTDAGIDGGARDAGIDAGPVVVVDGGLRFIDFGLVPVTFGSTRQLGFRTEATDEGFLIESLMDGGVTVVQVDSLQSPSGRFLIFGRDPEFQLSRSYPGVLAQAALVLESDDARADFVPGPWGFRVSVTDALTQNLVTGHVWVRVTVKSKVPPGPQRLPLNLFFTGGAGLSAASSLTQPRFVAALTNARAILGDAGIIADPIRRLDLPPGYSTIVDRYELPDASVTMSRTLDALFRTSARAPAGMNVFFVETLQPYPQIPSGAVLGTASGLPGTTLSQGSPASGVAVLYDTATFMPRRPGDLDTLGATIAHEVGHQLGLSHVYSMGGVLDDNLSDTPSEGEPEAEDNLMAPVSQSLGARLSPLQCTTLRRNPIVAP